MYYSEFARIRRLEKALERLAYLSVGIDVLIAVATYLALNGLKISGTLLMIGGYLMVVEVSLAALIFTCMLLSKHYRRTFDALLLTAFRSEYERVNGRNWYYAAAAKAAAKLLRAFQWVLT